MATLGMATLGMATLGMATLRLNLRPNLRLVLACWVFACHAAYPVHFSGRRIPSFAGPFRAVVERCEPCGDEAEGGVAVNVARVSRPRNIGDPQRVSGNITARVRLDDSITTVLKIDQWSSNGWKSNAFVLSVGGLCSGLRSLGLDLGAPPGEVCAVSDGVHSFSEHPADWRFESVPEFPYGKWRAAAIFSRRYATLGCVRCLFQTSPVVGSDL